MYPLSRSGSKRAQSPQDLVQKIAPAISVRSVVRPALSRQAQTSFKGLSILATLLVIAMVVAPMASAQSNVQRLDVTLQDFVDDPTLKDNRILPETGVAKVMVNALLNVNMYGRSASCSTPVQVDFFVNGPSYATAVMVPASKTLIIPGGTTSGGQAATQGFPVSAMLEITVDRDAPAFADGLYEVTMQARSQTTTQGSSGCDLGSSAPSFGTYRLKNDFTPRTSIETAALFANAGPNEKVVFPVTVQNVGNGPTRVNIALQSSDSNDFRAFSAGPDVRLPSPLGISGDSSERTILVQVTTPSTWGYTNQVSTLTATFTSTFDGVAPGTTFEETTELTFTVQTQGVYFLGLPTFIGVPLVLILVALAGAFGGIWVVAARARRAQKKEFDTVTDDAPFDADTEFIDSEEFSDETDQAFTDSEEFSEGTDLEINELKDFSDADPSKSTGDFVLMNCPQCATPNRVIRGSKPVCEHCNFS